MRINIVGAFIRNAPFGTEIAFQKGLQRLGGHDLTLIDTSYPDQQWDYDADLTIVFKWMEGYWEDLQRCGGKRVVYQPDDLRFPHIQQMMRDMRRYCDMALTFDDDGARMARDFGYRDARKLLLTADDELYRNLSLIRDIPICFIGSLTGGPNHASRLRMCQIIQREFPGKFLCLSDVYDIERIVIVYNRSKVVVNHATDVGQEFGTGYGYQCRHFEAGLTGAAVLSNKVLNGDELKNIEVFSNEDELVHQLHTLTDLFVNESGHHLYHELKMSHLPQHRATEMLQKISEMSCV